MTAAFDPVALREHITLADFTAGGLAVVGRWCELEPAASLILYSPQRAAISWASGSLVLEHVGAGNIEYTADGSGGQQGQGAPVPLLGHKRLAGRVERVGLPPSGMLAAGAARDILLAVNG